MKAPNCDIRDAYRRAISKIWGLKQKDIKRDIHIASQAPGQWSPNSLVEIYCEGEGEACDSSYVPQMRRSLVIEGNLFSISELGVMVSKVTDPETPLTMVPLL